MPPYRISTRSIRFSSQQRRFIEIEDPLSQVRFGCVLPSRWSACRTIAHWCVLAVRRAGGSPCSGTATPGAVSLGPFPPVSNSASTSFYPLRIGDSSSRCSIRSTNPPVPTITSGCVPVSSQRSSVPRRIRSKLSSHGCEVSGWPNDALRVRHRGVSEPPRVKCLRRLSTSFVRYRAPSGRQGYLAKNTPLLPATLAGGQIDCNPGSRHRDWLFSPNPSPHRWFGPRPRALSHADAEGLSPCAAANGTAGSSYYTLDQLGAAYGIGSLVSDGQNGHDQSIGIYELASSSQLPTSAPTRAASG